jgi:hypothetical protein
MSYLPLTGPLFGLNGSSLISFALSAGLSGRVDPDSDGVEDIVTTFSNRDLQVRFQSPASSTPTLSEWKDVLWTPHCDTKQIFRCASPPLYKRLLLMVVPGLATASESRLPTRPGSRTSSRKAGNWKREEQTGTARDGV